MKKIKLCTILGKKKSKNLGLSAPLFFLEGYEQKDNLKNNQVLISSKIESDFYRSTASVTFEFYKPISKI